LASKSSHSKSSGRYSTRFREPKFDLVINLTTAKALGLEHSADAVALLSGNPVGTTEDLKEEWASMANGEQISDVGLLRQAAGELCTSTILVETALQEQVESLAATRPGELGDLG
jgi:hypothetical protein